MSPEMKNDRGHTYSTDIWSAGCTLYELITLKRYYYDNSNDSIDNLNTKNIFKILLKKYNYKLKLIFRTVKSLVYPDNDFHFIPICPDQRKFTLFININLNFQINKEC
jgi:serine/threonine protein kinase